MIIICNESWICTRRKIFPTFWHTSICIICKKLCKICTQIVLTCRWKIILQNMHTLLSWWRVVHWFDQLTYIHRHNGQISQPEPEIHQKPIVPFCGTFIKNPTWKCHFARDGQHPSQTGAKHRLDPFRCMALVLQVSIFVPHFILPMRWKNLLELAQDVRCWEEQSPSMVLQHVHM